MARCGFVYIDLLGVQKMWQLGGANAVKSRIQEFANLIKEQLTYLPQQSFRDGDFTIMTLSDSVAITCQDSDQAIGIASHLFEQCFYHTDRSSSPLWLRGVISSWHNQNMVFNTKSIQLREISVGTEYKLEDDYLQAIALEKSGFKGMRLIIDQSLLPNSGKNEMRKWFGFKKPLFRIVRLDQCNYPGDEFADVLWMADTEAKYKDLLGIMAKRYKQSTRDPDELIQAAWTRAVFDQVDTLIWSCKNQ